MQIDFGTLILGHLVGDYLFQTDAMAANKRSSHMWAAGHCLVYTLYVMILNGSMFAEPSFGVPAAVFIFSTHFLLDRYGLARHLMNNLLMQERFAAGPLSPWSIIVIDNILHLWCLWIVFQTYHMPAGA